MWLVAMGFQHILYVKDESFIVIVVSRKLIWLLFCFSLVSCSVGWILLKSVRVLSMLELFIL
jgi:hypothetical protein